LDSGVKHALVDSEYNTRRKECDEGLAILKKLNPKIKSFRDVTFSYLKKQEAKLPKVVFKRCKYVVEEIARVEKACVALQKNDFKTLGKLMFQTHDGLNEQYQVSVPETNFLVEMARSNRNVLGARMMGGGFGGCTLNILKTSELERFSAQLKISYQRVFGIELKVYPVAITTGTEIISG
jgi:galactokinase